MPQPTRDDLVKTAQQLLDQGKTPDQVRAVLRSMTTQPPSFWDRHPTIAAGTKAIIDAFPGIGMVVGGAAGSELGPGGTIAGGGLGMAGGQAAKNAALRFTGLGGPTTLSEGMNSTVKAGAEGAALAAGGEALPVILSGAKAAADPMAVADDIDKASIIKPGGPVSGAIRRFVQGASDAKVGVPQGALRLTPAMKSDAPVFPLSENFPPGDTMSVTNVTRVPQAPAPELPPGPTRAALSPTSGIPLPPSSIEDALMQASEGQVSPETYIKEMGDTPAQMGKATIKSMQDAGYSVPNAGIRSSADIDTMLANKAAKDEVANSTPYERLGRDSTVPPPKPGPGQVVADTVGKEDAFSPEEMAQAEMWHSAGVDPDQIVQRILAMRNLAGGSGAVAGMPGNAQMAAEILSRSTDEP